MNQTLREAATMFQQGRLEDAQSRCSALVKTQPENVDAHYLMGLIHERSMHYDDAVSSFRKVLEHDPRHVAALVNVGGLLTTTGRPEEAIDPLRAALKIDREIFPARYNLARALNRTGNLKQAAREANRAWKLNPEAGEVQFLIGEIYSSADEVHKAIDGYRKCLEKLPDHVLAHLGLSRCLQLIGEFGEAKAHIERVLEFAPEHPSLHLSLCTQTRPEDEETRSLMVFQRALETEDIPEDLKIDMAFASARILDRQKKYDEAFAHYKAANDARYETYPFNRENNELLHKKKLSTFTSGFFEKRKDWGSESEKPVFIVGMPRSGTTLAEQKLAIHPDLFGMGEVTSFDYLAENLPGGMTIIDHFASFDQKTVLAAAKKYLMEIPSQAQPHARVVNKLPGNYNHLGIIATLFPKAKIIHCRRNVMDSGFSCYQQNFKEGNLRFTTNLDDLALVIKQYLEIMEHYRKVLPMEIFELDYEAMVADPDYWTNAMYEFIGVDPAKADGSTNDQVQQVKTASMWQVRQPVYETSVEKWRNYEKHLAGLANQLGFDANH